MNHRGLTEIVYEGLACRRMQWRGSFVLTEASIAWAMDNEEGRKWPSMRRLHPNSAAGAPNEQSRLNTNRATPRMAKTARCTGATPYAGTGDFLV